MGTELAAALEKLAQLLTDKNVENQSSSGAIVPQSETVQKLELMPVLVKLEGVSNYLSWSRRVLLILKTKGLTGHVLGEAVEPADTKGADWQKWSATDSLIFAWMLNSLAPGIATSVEVLPNAAAVWGLLSKRYSGKGNVMLMAQIESKVHDVRQGDRSVLAYVAELQQLWADLDQCDPLELTHTESLAIAEAWIGRRRVMQYLKGLNPLIESRRATLLHQPKLCSLDEAIAAMSQEEVRLQFSKDGSNESAYKVDEQRVWRETRECFNCGKPGHLKRNCTAPRKGGGRGSSGGGYSGGKGRGSEPSYHARSSGSPHQAHLAAGSDGRAGTSAAASSAEHGAENFGHLAHFVYTDEGEADWQEDWDGDQA